MSAWHEETYALRTHRGDSCGGNDEVAVLLAGIYRYFAGVWV